MINIKQRQLCLAPWVLKVSGFLASPMCMPFQSLFIKLDK